MTILSSQEVESQVKPMTGTVGPVAGLGIHYDIEGATDLSTSTGTATIKLNEKSLEKAEEKTGVTRTPKKSHKPTVSKKTAKKQENTDDAFATMFSKRGLSSRVGFGARPHYRGALSTAKGPLARVKKRRLLELRRTFDQIAAMKHKKVAVSAEGLAQDTIRRMVDEAIKKGDKVTPLGSIEQTARKAGMKVPKKKKKQRQWALFMNPELIPSGWAMD